MCIKKNGNEISSVRALMNMSLDALIADTFEIDIEEINASLNLRSDLGMKTNKEEKLQKYISEYFDGLRVDMKQMITIGDLHEMVVEHEFEDISDTYFN